MTKPKIFYTTSKWPDGQEVVHKHTVRKIKATGILAEMIKKMQPEWEDMERRRQNKLRCENEQQG